MGEWHYHQGGQQYGPVTFQQLQQMAQSGQLNPTDLVWSESLPDWQEARTVQGLFAATGPQYQAPPPGGPGPAAPAPGAYQQRPVPQGVPGIVIAGFIFVFLCSPLGIILCAVGMGEAKRRGAGVGLAWAGIILGIVFILLSIVVNVVAVNV